MAVQKKSDRGIDIVTINPGEPIEVPLIKSGVFAGFPSPAQDSDVTSIDLNKELIRHPNTTFLARIVGDSMIGADIHEGDIVIIDRSLEFHHNDIAVCCLNGEFNIKHVERTGDEIFLISSNSKYPKIKVDPEDNFVLWGVVTYIIHKPNSTRR